MKFWIAVMFATLGTENGFAQWNKDELEKVLPDADQAIVVEMTEVTSYYYVADYALGFSVCWMAQ